MPPFPRKIIHNVSRPWAKVKAIHTGQQTIGNNKQGNIFRNKLFIVRAAGFFMRYGYRSVPESFIHARELSISTGHELVEVMVHGAGNMLLASGLCFAHP